MMAATKRMRPPQSGHCSTSISRPRRMSSAQVRLHGPATFFGVARACSCSPRRPRRE
jgi:hypothetical protein